MSLAREQQKFLRDLGKLFTFIWDHGFEITGGELWRTPEQQALYLANGKSKTKNSMHLKRCAIDLNFFKDGLLITTKLVLQEIGNYWESLDEKNQWGGNWKSFQDCPHFERHVE